MKIAFGHFLFLLLIVTSCLAENKESSSTESFRRLEIKIEPLSWNPRIFILRDFLTENECDHLIAIAKDKLTRSTIVDHITGSNKIDDVRTSEGMFISKNHEDSIVKDIEERISLVTLIPQQNGEDLQILHYDQGGEFKPHHDYFNLLTSGGIVNFRRGGQRVASFLMYLNTPEEGGETTFPKVSIKVTPKKGDALLFFDCCLDGRTDPLTFHGGLPVIKGEKWLATKWLRQDVFK